MKRRLASPLLLASVLATAAFAVSAQGVNASVAVDAGAPAAIDADARLDVDATPQIDRNCLTRTGSRIVARDSTTRSTRERNEKFAGRCVPANGRVYSREDIERTGEVDIANALRKLDPAIR